MLLHVNVVQATHVPTNDFLSKSDPYVVIEPSFSNTTVKTRYIKDNDNPIFKEQFTFVLKNKEEDYLTFRVFDYNDLMPPTFVADLKLPVRDFIEGEVKTFTYQMEPAGSFNQSPNLLLQIQMAVRGRPKFVPYQIIKKTNAQANA